jgi:hypothetical protein
MMRMFYLGNVAVQPFPVILDRRAIHPCREITKSAGSGRSARNGRLKSIRGSFPAVRRRPGIWHRFNKIVSGKEWQAAAPPTGKHQIFVSRG